MKRGAGLGRRLEWTPKNVRELERVLSLPGATVATAADHFETSPRVIRRAAEKFELEIPVAQIVRLPTQYRSQEPDPKPEPKWDFSGDNLELRD